MLQLVADCPPTAMTNGDRLILLLAPGTIPARVQEPVRALLEEPLNEQGASSGQKGAQSLDWELILERVTSEGVYPLFYRNLEKLGCGAGKNISDSEVGISECSPDVTEEQRRHSLRSVRPISPKEAQEQLQKLSKINAFRNALLTEELIRLLNLLAEDRLPTIPLKGMTLAESIYGDTAARVCSDIDILVPRRSVPKAFSILVAAGFEAHDQKVELSEISRLLDSNIEYSFVSRRDGFTFLLELHWDIAWRWGKNSVVIDDLWADAQPKSYWTAGGYGLSPEWELLYLVVHAAHHQWQGLKWLVDIHEMCARSKIDWERLRSKANRLGLERMLALTLSACHKLFDTSIPAGLLISPLPDWMKVFPDVATPTDVWKNNFFPARLFKRPSEKLGYLARIAFIPTLNEQRFISLPSFLEFLYYPLRPLRLMCKWGWAALRGFAALAIRGQRSEVGGQL